MGLAAVAKDLEERFFTAASGTVDLSRQRHGARVSAYQAMAKVSPRCERAFSADSLLENLDDSRIAGGFHASIR